MSFTTPNIVRTLALVTTSSYIMISRDVIADVQLGRLALSVPLFLLFSIISTVTVYPLLKLFFRISPELQEKEATLGERLFKSGHVGLVVVYSHPEYISVGLHSAGLHSIASIVEKHPILVFSAAIAIYMHVVGYSIPLVGAKVLLFLLTSLFITTNVLELAISSVASYYMITALTKVLTALVRWVKKGDVEERNKRLLNADIVMKSLFFGTPLIVYFHLYPWKLLDFTAIDVFYNILAMSNLLVVNVVLSAVVALRIVLTGTNMPETPGTSDNRQGTLPAYTESKTKGRDLLRSVRWYDLLLAALEEALFIPLYLPTVITFLEGVSGGLVLARLLLSLAFAAMHLYGRTLRQTAVYIPVQFLRLSLGQSLATNLLSHAIYNTMVADTFAYVVKKLVTDTEESDRRVTCTEDDDRCVTHAEDDYRVIILRNSVDTETEYLAILDLYYPESDDKVLLASIKPSVCELTDFEIANIPTLDEKKLLLSLNIPSSAYVLRSCDERRTERIEFCVEREDGPQWSYFQAHFEEQSIHISYHSFLEFKRDDKNT